MRFADWIISRIAARKPDFIIGGLDNPYLLRWFVNREIYRKCS